MATFGPQKRPTRITDPKQTYLTVHEKGHPQNHMVLHTYAPFEPTCDPFLVHQLPTRGPGRNPFLAHLRPTFGPFAALFEPVHGPFGTHLTPLLRPFRAPLVPLLSPFEAHFEPTGDHFWTIQCPKVDHQMGNGLI